MENMAQSVSQLDLEYLQILRDIKPYITCIMDANNIGLIKVWLEKLGQEGQNDRSLRNAYLLRLREQLLMGVLDNPFTEEPSEGTLMPLESLSEFEDTCDEFMEDTPCTSHLDTEQLNNLQLNYNAGPNCSGQKLFCPEVLERITESELSDSESSWIDLSPSPSRRNADGAGRNNQFSAGDTNVDDFIGAINNLRNERGELVSIVKRSQLMLDNPPAETNEKVSKIPSEFAANVQNQSKVLINEKKSKWDKKQFEKELENARNQFNQQMSCKLKEFNEKFEELKRYYDEKVIEDRTDVEYKLKKSYEEEITLLKASYEVQLENYRLKIQTDETAMTNLKSQFEEKQKLFELKKTQELENYYKNFYEPASNEQLADLTKKYEAKISEIHSEHIEEIKLKNAEIQRLEVLLQKQCTQMQEEVKRIRSELEASGDQDAQMKINYLKKCIMKMDKLYRKAEKEFGKQVEKIQREYALRDQHLQIVTRTEKLHNLSCSCEIRRKEIDNIIFSLEAKYKEMLLQQQAESMMEKRAHLRQISELQTELTCRKAKAN